MRILLSTYGSRGDVEPMAALGAAIQALGAEAIVSAPSDEEFVQLLARARVPLAPAFSTAREWATKAMNVPRDPATLSAFIKERAVHIVAAQYDAINAAAEGCDLILATGLTPSVFAARAVAEKRGLPFVSAAYCPIYLPSEHHAPISFPGNPPPGTTDIRELWRYNAEAMNATFGEPVNALRASIGLSPVNNVRDHTKGDGVILGADPVLGPWRPTDMCDVIQTGAFILPDTRPLPDDLEAFLNAGDPPVYIGFGSMTQQSAKDAVHAAIAAARAHGRRVVMLQGWGDMTLIDDNTDCIAVADINQQTLFPRVATVIHHGGAGTTHAAARAGAPQIVVPQIGDQTYWANRVAQLAIGAAHPGPVATRDSLSAALGIALAPETRQCAAAVAATFRTDGAATAANLLMERAASANRQQEPSAG